MSVSNSFVIYQLHWESKQLRLSALQQKKLNLPGCKRIGILASSTNGYRDLVCGRDTVLYFDGDDYE